MNILKKFFVQYIRNTILVFLPIEHFCLHLHAEQRTRGTAIGWFAPYIGRNCSAIHISESPPFPQSVQQQIKVTCADRFVYEKIVLIVLLSCLTCSAISSSVFSSTTSTILQSGFCSFTLLRISIRSLSFHGVYPATSIRSTSGASRLQFFVTSCGFLTSVV